MIEKIRSPMLIRINTQYSYIRKLQYLMQKASRFDQYQTSLLRNDQKKRSSIFLFRSSGAHKHKNPLKNRSICLLDILPNCLEIKVWNLPITWCPRNIGVGCWNWKSRSLLSQRNPLTHQWVFSLRFLLWSPAIRRRNLSIRWIARKENFIHTLLSCSSKYFCRFFRAWDHCRRSLSRS